MATEQLHTDPHRNRHGDRGATPGERADRDLSPVIKVVGLAWLEFVKTDLDLAHAFAVDFGFTVSEHTPELLRLRGARGGNDCVIIRRGPRPRFVAPVFQAATRRDLDRFAAATGATVIDRADGGYAVTARTPSGMAVRVAHGAPRREGLPRQRPLNSNTGGRLTRVNERQHPPRQPALVERLGHVALSTPLFTGDLDWLMHHLGLIASDFLYLDGQRDRGPVAAFLRCDRGIEPTDHHTVGLYLGPHLGHAHSAYEVADLDALALGGEYLKERGYQRSWGIGRHSRGGQIFDYWRDPDRLLVAHCTDGDRFDASVQPGWAPMSASGLAQWGPPPTADFLGRRPTPSLLRHAIAALRADNEITPTRLIALIKAMST